VKEHLPEQVLNSCREVENGDGDMKRPILTESERWHIKAYVAQDGEKNVNVRQIVLKARRFLRQIEQDLWLPKRPIRRYQNHR